MKKTITICAMLVAAVLMAGCDLIFGHSGSFQVEGFGFQDENGQYGVMDMDGNVIVEPQFEYQTSAVINDRFYVYDMDYYTIYTADEDMEEIGTYKDVGSFTNDYCPVIDKKGRVKYIDKDGNDAFDMKKVSKKRVVCAFSFFDGRGMVKTDNGKWGYIDESGEPVIPIKYADAWNFASGLAIVYHELPYENDDAKWSVIDTDGNIIYTKKFKDMSPSNFRYYGDYLVVLDEKDNRQVILDREGKTVKKLKDEQYAGNIFDDKFVVNGDGVENTGLMGVDGKMVIKPKYDSMSWNGKLLAGTSDGRPTLLNLDGEKVAKLPKGFVVLFDPEVKNYDKRFLLVDDDGVVRFFDDEGKEIELDYEMHDYSVSYSWGVMTPEETDDCEVDEDYE